MSRKKKHVIPLQLVELEDGNYHILIESIFQNGTKGKWAIDTGASKTVFDANQLDHFKITDNSNNNVQSAGIGEGQIETQTGMLTSFKIGEAEIKNRDVAVIDLKHVNKLYKQFINETIVGLLGSDFLVEYKAIIDFQKMQLIIYA
jgi:predicted aspartyl protease